MPEHNFAGNEDAAAPANGGVAPAPEKGEHGSAFANGDVGGDGGGGSHVKSVFESGGVRGRGAGCEEGGRLVPYFRKGRESRAVTCFEKLELRGEGTYGQVCLCVCVFVCCVFVFSCFRV